jgi:integrase
MSIRKRTWKNARGEMQEAWIVDYVDQHGKRHIKTFGRKKDADAYHATVAVEVRQGIHTPASSSITVATAAEDWITYVELEGRERATVAQYRAHARHHIIPRIGAEKLATLTTPRINAFRDHLLRDLSRSLARKVLKSLKSILKDAQRRGNVAQNVARDVSIVANKRVRKLEIGVDIPSPDEIGRILAAATGRWRPFLITAIFTGMRASELRGLRWVDVDLARGEIHVRQRADRYNEIGLLKSKSSERTIPIGPFVANTLREWHLACPFVLVFPNSVGNVPYHASLVQRVLLPVQVAAGVVTSDGKAKYTGLHALRHFYASWCINRKVDGGLELPAKIVQVRLGHASIVMTMDTYGHLFPQTDDGSELAVAERKLLRPVDAT